LETALTEFQSDFQDSKDNLLEKITDNTMALQKMASHSDRIAKLEEDLIDLENEMKKARQEGAIDYDALCSKKEYLAVMDLIGSIHDKDSE
jgi:arginine utilization protein RocB